jgi:thiol-disulfide isomerase/thioredoxin
MNVTCLTFHLRFILIALIPMFLIFNISYNSIYALTPIVASNEGIQIGDSAPEFKLTDPEKGAITKGNFTGKPLFIFFTATWCTPCQIGAENLARYDDEHGGNVFNVLIVFIDDKETDNQFIDWKKQFGRDDWYIAKGIEMVNNYQVQFLDTKYVFNKDGIIKWVDLKPLEYSAIDPILSPLL